MNIVFLAE